MSHLNRYVHTCVDQPKLVCPACKWAEEHPTTDVLVYDEGTIWLFNPVSKDAKTWIKERVPAEPWQWLCNVLAVEHRYAPAIVGAAMSQGPTIPTGEAVKIVLEVAALFLAVLFLLPWACGMLR